MKRWPRWTLCAVALIVLAGGLAPSLHGQPLGEGQGEAVLRDWPGDLRQARQHIRTDLQLLPELDRIDLSYRYQARQQDAAFSFVLAWRPGDEALYQGRIMRYRSLPDGIRMTAIEVEADVQVGGETVAQMLIGVDSMALAPHPAVYSFEVPEVSYDTVFLDTPPDKAQRYLQDGITLQNLRISRVAFGIPRSEREERKYRDERPRESASWSIYAPRVNVILGWRIGPRPYYLDRSPDPRSWRPRGDDVGRTASDSGRTGSDTGRGSGDRSGDDSGERGEATSGRGDKPSRDKDDDDEDKDSLLPASAVALAGVGLAAIIGGTVGYAGTGKTPIGLMAGWVRPEGGTLLHASINRAVLDDDGGREHLTVKGIGFYDVFDAPVQPALGLGALARAEGNETTWEASVSVGAALNLGRVVLTGGYDVVQSTPEVGIAINIRYRKNASQ